PLAEIAAVCHEYGVYLHTDAVQAAGELSLNVDELGVDLLSLSGHKIYGPKGVGALYVRSGVRLQPQMDGGGQEMERRAGTEAVAAIVGFATALQLAHDDTEINRQRHLRDILIDALLAIPGTTLNGGRAPRLCNNINVSFAGIPGETLLQALDLSGIAVSTGAACSAGAVEASHVLLALGVPPATAAEAVRFSLGRGVTVDDIQHTIITVQQIIARLRGESRG
ncbi:MAG: aminotransferase class V-fold PLP-dependent enzyme, partial [bacterium]